MFPIYATVYRTIAIDLSLLASIMNRQTKLLCIRVAIPPDGLHKLLCNLASSFLHNSPPSSMITHSMAALGKNCRCKVCCCLRSPRCFCLGLCNTSSEQEKRTGRDRARLDALYILGAFFGIIKILLPSGS